MSGAFDAALPPAYSDSWKQAERASPEDSPRLTSYQAPGGEAIPFILKSFKFSGGQSMDTAEYPFGGLWSNETLNEKPQALQIEGFLRGAEYIQARNALIEALSVTTSDSDPGYIDFPFWGRFPIVVADYEIAETADEKGQCALMLVFKRAGVSSAERASSPPGIAASHSGMSTALEKAAEDLEAAAINSFEQTFASNEPKGFGQTQGNSAESSFAQMLEGSAESSTARILSQGFAKIKAELLSNIGRIQAAQSKLNALSNEISGIASLVSQSLSAPGQLARSLFSAAASISASLAEIKNSIASYLPKGSAAGNPSYPAPAHNNEETALLQFLSASSFALDSAPMTVRQESAQKAIENLYRMAAFATAGKILPQLDISFQKAEGYWKLFKKLEESIDKNDPSVYAAIETMRIYVSCILSAKELSAEKTRNLNAPLPLLSLAQYLGCDEGKLRDLNRIADSFVVKGSVLYV